MEEVKNSIGFFGKLVVDAKGKAGGLCLMWKWGVNVEVEEFNKNLLAVKIKDTLCEWMLVGYQGPPYLAKKRKAWENLCAILESFQGPWVCLGDFNYIVSAEEKYGGAKGGTSAPNYLKELMFDLGAIDLGYSGNKFTWAKGRWGSAAIKERLDRGLANISWRLVFPKAAVQHLGALNSDHLPILLDTNPDDCFSPRPFHFEAAWIRDERCQEVVEKAWNIEVWGSQLSRLCKKQDAAREALRKWNKEIFGNVQMRISSLMEKLKETQENPIYKENNRLEIELQNELNEWLYRSEVLWRQKSRELWLREGDKNSKFFHLSTIVRRRRNTIEAVKNNAGD